MNDINDTTSSRRNLLAMSALGAVGLGLASTGAANAQLLSSSIAENSVLSKIKKAGELKIGYSQGNPWFYKDLKAGTLAGIYYELCEMLARDLEVKASYTEVTFANSTVSLRNGEFDLFGSTLVYTPQRALVANYIGPLWEKGLLAMTHKDFASRFKTSADFNNPDVIFSVAAGGAQLSAISALFPKAQVITTTGQDILALEPVRSKKAHLYVTGDSEVVIATRRNADWAVIVDEANPFAKRMNTWAIRYGDPDWKFFLDMWVANVIAGNGVRTLYDKYMANL